MKESKLKKHLETLTKEQIIELYLQKCFDTKFEQNKLAIEKLEELHNRIYKNKAGRSAV